MIIVGLTGTFGSGKSRAAEFFRQKGSIIIDADGIVHDLYRPGTKCWRLIKNCFGKEILNKNKTINRLKLSQIVFASAEQMKKLLAIVHPPVIREIKRRIGNVKSRYKEIIIVIDAPLLFETGLDKICDFTVCVWARRNIMIERVLKKRALTRSQIIQRITSQMPVKEKKSKADFIIDNSGSFLKTKKQITEVLKEMKRRIGK